ncbi:phosphoglycerate mutase-like protein [Glonium stellatum]|uniref:Phosphoglycerate mutase-like protein n=1 Tax=Glonium stellatum TaxID=574774 RepID=A0A8E2JQD5_9PEZI|nr:phosphoglycerate mutase-like protein [Glonium stellatum]
MPPTLVLVRHAQALHNIDKDRSIPDPDLSPLGFEQCVALRDHLKENLPQHPDVDLIIVSPMRRAIQTASVALDWLIERGVKVHLDADWQENSNKPCDTGTAISELKKEFPNFDFSSVDNVYPDKTSPAGRRYAHTKSAVLARAQACLHNLYHRPEKMILIVSHSAFLRLAVSGTCFANADYRIFEVSKPNEPHDTYKLREWERTSMPGGGMGRSPKEPVEIGSGDLPLDLPQDSRETLGHSPEN